MTVDPSRLLATRFKGGSMAPTLRDGDVILWRGNDGHPVVHVGDVVGFFEHERLVAHRVIELDAQRDLATTRGDAHLSSDPPLAMGDIAYVAVAALRGQRPVPLGPISDPLRLSLALAHEARRVGGALRQRVRRIATLRPPKH